MGTRLLRLLLLATSLQLASTPALYAAEPSGTAAAAEEAAVKAAFVFNFARFAEWPPSAASAPRGPGFNLCTTGQDPALARALDALGRRAVQNRPVRLLHQVRAEDLKLCHLLYVGADDAARLPALQAALAGQPVLTVSDLPGFARRGGMVGLLRVGDKLRFALNRDAAQAAGLKLSVNLLTLAVEVIDSSAPSPALPRSGEAGP